MLFILNVLYIACSKSVAGNKVTEIFRYFLPNCYLSIRNPKYSDYGKDTQSYIFGLQRMRSNR